MERAESKILHACRLLIPTCARNSTQSRFLQESELLGDQILHGFVFERDIRHHLLEAGVLFFKLPHLFGFGNVHAAEFRFPSVEGLTIDSVFAYKLFYTDAGFLFLEDGDHLFFSEFTLVHLTVLLSKF